MTVVVEFKERGTDPVQVMFGLAGSTILGDWQNVPTDLATIAAVDQLPWGSRPENTPAAVRAVGELLRTKLASVVPIKNALANAFAIPEARRPVYFHVGYDSSVESFPLETLWDDQRGFACLQPAWPIARIPADAAPPPGPPGMERTVRIVAVLAAEGISPRNQLAALEAACATQPGLSTEVTVITSSTAVRNQVINAGRLGWGAELVPATGDDLILRIYALQPHLLHLFCHGTADGPRLLVAQKDDLGVLELSTTHFSGLAQPRFLAPWLVSLHCCEGGAPGEQTVSLASGMVRSGMPAVLGMRTVVDASVADAFCEDLYTSVLGRLAEIAPTGAAGATLNWPEVIYEPRRRLCAAHGATALVAGRQKEWTIPVLYLASTTLRLRGRPRDELDDQRVRAELTNLLAADGLEADGLITSAMADSMRAPSLTYLYGGE